MEDGAKVEGAFARVQDAEGVHYDKLPEPVKTGQAMVETVKSKTKREIEMEAGRARIAEAKAEVASRPPRVISEAERRAQGGSVPVFRPNMLGIDRMNTGIGPLMRKVGGPKPQAQG